MADCDERLVTLELCEELMNRVVDNRDNIDNFLHDFILHEDIALGLDDLNI